MNLDGSFSNESEAAFDLSRRETNLNPDGDRIAALIAEGRFVVTHNYITYCRLTDAALGEAARYAGDYATREEAVAAQAAIHAEKEEGDETWATVLPYEARTSSWVLPDTAEFDDCPF